MLRLSRFGLPLLLAFAVTGCDAVDSTSADAPAVAQAVPPLDVAPYNLPVCLSREYSYDTTVDGYFRVNNGSGQATVLSQSGGDSKASNVRTAQVGGLARGSVFVEYVRSSDDRVIAGSGVRVVPNRTNLCEF